MRFSRRLVSGGRKSFVEPDFWADDTRLRFLNTPTGWGDREEPDREFTEMVRSVYKRNGIIAALSFTRMAIFSEATFQYRRRLNGRGGDLFGTKALGKLEIPWPNGTTGDLLKRMIQDADAAGNSYYADRPRGLRRMRPDWVTILLGSNDEPAENPWEIDAEVIGYLYEPGGAGSTADAVVLLPRQVAHFAPIPDPDAQFRGMSWVSPVIRELEADSAATTHKLNFFRNGATPQLVVSMDKAVKPESFQKFKAAMEAKHKGVANAYRTLYLGAGADVTVVGKDLKELDFRGTQGAGETRMAAAAGVPPVIAGFSEGLQAATYSNYGQARRRFADGTLRPLWRDAAGALAPLVPAEPDAQLWYDDRDIAFLREDRLDVANIQREQASTIRALADSGFLPESVVAAVQAEDWSLLRHSGLFSVQLQKPGDTSGTSTTVTNPKMAAELMTMGWKVAA